MKKNLIFLRLLVLVALLVPVFVNAGFLPSGTYNNIDDSNCTAPASSGGWGGVCGLRAVPMSDGCTTGNGSFVGVGGGIYSSGESGCCAPAGAIGSVASLSIPEAICEGTVTSGGKGGTCRFRSLPGSDGCDNATEDFVGLCRTTLSSNGSGCCVLKGSTPAATTSPASPATGFKYQPLEPIPGAKDASSFPEYIQAIYKFGLWTVGLAALLMLTVGGFMYVTSAGNTSLIGSAKGIIQDSIIGIILALAAYFILNIINPDFVHVNLNSFSGVGGSLANTAASPEVNASANSTNSLRVWAGDCRKDTDSHTAAEVIGTTTACIGRQMTNKANADGYGSITSSNAQNVLVSAGNIGAAGFDISSSGNCWDSSCTNCTSLQQIPKYAIQYLKDLKTKSGCSDTLVITGGTEYGHTTHCPGAPSVDIRNTDAGGTCLGNYFKSIVQSVGGDSVKYRAALIANLHIDIICSDPAWPSVISNCGTYQEPNGHFHISFCGYVHGASGSSTGSVQCK